MNHPILRTIDFDFPLPKELIAQTPATERDQSRLLVLDRDRGKFAHRQFGDLLEYIAPGDVLVLNNSRVIPARLRGFKEGSGGEIEVLLLEENQTNDWWALLRPARRVRAGTSIHFRGPDGTQAGISAAVQEKNPEGHCRLQFSGVTDLNEKLDSIGETPLPPYISRAFDPAMDCERYQTVYAGPAGSVAAPTAGLHFTARILEDLKRRGVILCFVTLHVGLGTFAPVKADRLTGHNLHEERFVLSSSTARAINQAKRTGRRVIAVGTTAVRVLETVAGQNQGKIMASSGRTGLFIYPPFDFSVVDALVTNFHLPKSTLLMLVSAFAAPGETRGLDLIISTYAEVVRQRYRFFSYGDAMLIL